MNLKLLVLFTLLAFLLPGISSAEDPAATPCSPVFIHVAEDIEEYPHTPNTQIIRVDEIGKIPLRTFFSESRDLPAGELPGTTMLPTQQDLAKFNETWDEFFALTLRLDPTGKFAKDAIAFRTWLRLDPKSAWGYPDIRTENFENKYVRTNKIFEDFFYDQYRTFLKRRAENIKAPFRQRFVSRFPRSISELSQITRRDLGWWFGLTSGSVTGYLIGTAITGPVNGMVKELVKWNPDMGERLGQNAVKKVTSLFDTFEGGKEAYTTNLKLIEDEVANFRKVKLSDLSKRAAKQQIDIAESEFGSLLSRYSGVLDRADGGRAGVLNTLADQVKGTLSLVMTNYNASKQSMKDLEDEIAKGSTDPAVLKEQNEAKQGITRDLIASQTIIAQILATWKVYKLSLHDPNQKLDVDISLQTEFLFYTQNMDLNIYREQLLLVLGDYVKKLKDFNK